MVVAYGRGNNFRSAGGAGRNQDFDRSVPDHLVWIGVELLPRNRLTLESGDGAGGNQELGGGNSFRSRAPSTIAQIEYELVQALFIELLQLVADSAAAPVCNAEMRT